MKWINVRYAHFIDIRLPGGYLCVSYWKGYHRSPKGKKFSCEWVAL